MADGSETGWHFDQVHPISNDLQEKLSTLQNFNGEYDQTRRNCEVWIFTVPIKMLKAMKKTNLRCFRHWFVVCDFGNRAVRCELDNPSAALAGGEIQPRWSIFTFNESSEFGNEEDMANIEGALLGSITTSPRKLYELVCTHEMNFKKYHAVDNNCHKWVMELFRSLPGNMQEAAKTAKLVPLGETNLFLRSSARKFVKCAMSSQQSTEASRASKRSKRITRSTCKEEVKDDEDESF